MSSDVTAATVRYLFTCGTCRKTFRRDFAALQEVSKITVRSPSSLYPPGEYRTRTRVYGVKRDPNGETCPGCARKGLQGKEVRGIRTDHACGAKCLASKGPTCECACGGENHGKNYL